MFQRTFLSGLAVSLLVVQACGSDDGKKRVMQDGDAGMGGEAGSGEGPGAGGSIAGKSTGGMPNTSGNAGEGVVSGGEGGTGATGEEPIGGSGGQPPILPDPEFLFVVRDDALGLDDTAVANATHKQNAIYTTRTALQGQVAGTNEVKVVGADMGLAEQDAIVAFAELQPEPASPFYLFSVVEGAEGAYVATTIDEQQWFDEPSGGDVFFSDGSESFRYLGEGGDEFGYNGLSFSEVSLGLSRGAVEAGPDELRDVLARDANQPLTELYFTVNSASVGATDSAVDATPSEERGCTVFKSGLDGTNTVAFSCSDLGLIAGDQIDALTLYGSETPEQVVFSVSTGSQGALGTSVADTVTSGEAPGSALFGSTGDSSNEVLATARMLGLGANAAEPLEDDVDGLTVLDVPVGAVGGGLNCTASFDPFATAEGALVSNSGVIGIGQEVAVLVGRKANLVTSLVAFDVATCAFLQQKDLTEVLEVASGTAIVRLPNWSKATPLDNVEYFQPVTNASSQLLLQRYDATGVATDNYLFTNLNANDPVEALTHDRTSDQLYLVTGYSYPYRLRLTIFPVPDETVTELVADPLQLALPCSSDPNYVGTEPSGNLVLAQRQADGLSFRVCRYAPSGQLLPSPYTWTPQTMPQQAGFIGDGALHVSVTTDNGAAPVSIERGTYALP